MFSEKSKTAPIDPEATDLAHIREDEESSEVPSTFAVKGKVHGCLQVLGAFFIFFNVWSVNLSSYNSISKLTSFQGPKSLIWNISKLLCTHLYPIINIIRHRLDWDNPILAPDRRRSTIRPTLRPRLCPRHCIGQPLFHNKKGCCARCFE